jgi:hypothetical protein
VVGLTTDQAAKVENHTLSFITLSDNRDVGVLKSRKLFLVPLALALEFLGNLLLKNESLESIVTLLLSPREAGG